MILKSKSFVQNGQYKKMVDIKTLDWLTIYLLQTFIHVLVVNENHLRIQRNMISLCILKNIVMCS